MKSGGKLIVIEAGDGSGKATQAALLTKKITENNFSAKKISFPNYDSPSSALIKMYLNGEFGNEAAAVNAYAASLFYAVDRFASYRMDWRIFLANGGVVVADRYVTSNMAHQAAKITDVNAREKFLAWLYDLEYEKLELPKPDIVIFLDMPPDVSAKLIAARARKSDIHEKDREYLKKSYAAYSHLTEKYGWRRIACTDDKNELLTPEQIHTSVWTAVKEIL